MNVVVQYSKMFGLLMSTAKTKTLVFSKHLIDLSLRIDGRNIEQVSSIKYVGTILNDSCDINREIWSRIEQARRTFLNMKNVFTRSELSLNLCMRMVRCYIFSVLLYRCESWSLSPEMERKITSFKMYICYT